MPGSRQPGRNREGVSLATSTTLTSFDVGKTFFAAGSGALTVTLPDPTTCVSGADIEVCNTVGQNLLCTSTSTLITFNNAAASTVAYQTGGELIGGSFRFISTGSKWFVQIIAEETQTVTVT